MNRGQRGFEGEKEIKWNEGKYGRLEEIKGGIRKR